MKYGKIKVQFHVVVVENKEMCKKVFCTCKVVVFFLLIRPVVFCCSRCRRRLVLHDFVFCLNKVQVYYYRELRFQPWLNLYIISKRKPQNKHRQISMLHSTNNVVKLDSNGLIYKIAVSSKAIVACSILSEILIQSPSIFP